MSAASLVGVQKDAKKKKLTSRIMHKYYRCKGPRFSPAAREAWEAYLRAVREDEDATCVLCHRALTPADAAWIDDLKESGRALDLIGRNVCPCIERCHLECLIDKSAHVWARHDASIDDTFKGGVTSISSDFHLKCMREPPGRGIPTSPPATVLQIVCPTGHSCAVLMPLLSHPHSFGPTIDDTEATFEPVRVD